MALMGKQKAAMLLMSLDGKTAAELLKGIDAEVVQELAVELAYLDAAGYRDSRQSLELARQFCNSLQAQDGFHLKDFLKEMLKSSVGNEKAEQIQTQIQNLLQKRDPFITIRSVGSQALASVLEDGHPQAIAVVLSELPPKKSSEVLGLLGEDTRRSVINIMTSPEVVTAEAKTRIAEMVCNNIESIRATGQGGAVQPQQEQSLRKVAVILRDLGRMLRGCLFGTIQK